MKIKTYLLLLLILNCISVTNLKLDKESAKIEKENYYFVSDKLGEGRPYSFRDLMELISNQNYEMQEIESETSIKNKKYYKLYVKHLNEPSIWKSFLLIFSIMTFSIIPVETKWKNRTII